MSWSGSSASTVLDGEGDHQILYAGNDVDLLLSSLSFVGGFAPTVRGPAGTDGDGGAVKLKSGSLEVDRCVFRDNGADYGGGAIWSYGATAIYDSSFVGNSSGYEGGAISAGGWDITDMRIEDSTFTANRASYEGGALSLGSWGDDLWEFDGVTFRANSSGSGGAIDVGTWGTAVLWVTDTDFRANRSTSSCSAVCLDGWADDIDAAFVRSTFDGNVSTASDSTIGVGSRVERGRIELASCDLRSNTGTGLVLPDTFEGTVSDTDFGTGAQANTPYDFVGGGYQVMDLGDGANFSCDIGGICSGL